VPGATYDTSALLAAERNDRRMWAIHAELLADRVVPTVPAPVLAQAWRGGSRQARLAQLLVMCVVEPMTEQQARSIGVLAGVARHSEIIDVAVAEGAIRRADVVVTSDAGEVGAIGAAVTADIRIIPI